MIVCELRYCLDFRLIAISAFSVLFAVCFLCGLDNRIPFTEAVTERRYFLTLDKNGIAYRAILAFGKTVFRAGRLYSLDSNFGVFRFGDYLLLYQNGTAY